MKVILCDNGLPGLIRFRYDVMSHFVEKGDQVIVLYPKCTEDQEWLSKLPNGVRTCSIGFNPSSTNPLGDLVYWMSLLRVYRRNKPDMCIHYTIKPNIYGTLAARMCGVKNIAMVAGLGYMFQGNGVTKKFGRFLYKIGLHRANIVITLNSTIKNLLVNRGFVKEEKIVLFEGGEGVNLERYPLFVQKYEVPVTFLTVARVFYDKGYKEYVEAAKLVHQKYPNVVFEWLGDYDERSPMTVPKQVLDSDTQAGHIKYLGTTDDVLQYLRRDGVCICLPSYHEGLSKSLMEACSIGLPIIASDIPGCQECVDNGVNGYLVPKQDSQSLANAMSAFLELSKSDKSKMAMASYQKALKTFDVQKVIHEYEEIIKGL